MPARTSRARVTAVDADDAGLHVTGKGDLPLDVCFDGRRIFSFWLTRDTRPGEDGRRFYAWPKVLSRFLDGRTALTLVDPSNSEVLAATDARLGSGEGEIRIEDAQGNPMGLDKSLRLTRLFGSRDPSHMVPLLDAMETVLEALETAGLRPFLAYGTLLGAVRDQDFIGHDSDADLGYVSNCDHPVDAMLESFHFQRRIQELGYQVQRYSGLAFKVLVKESDGTVRGLDVFGGFMREGTLYLMGEVGHPFEQSWLHPRTEVTLAGRTFPAPAVPEKLLEAMYGPTWRVPDPAYKFTTPLATQRRLNGWFRGTRVGFDGRWARMRAKVEPRPPAGSKLARYLHRQERKRGTDLSQATVIDLGCGRGRDVMWLGRRDVHTIGLDYFPIGFKRNADRAAAQELPVRFAWSNLNELRSVLLTGAELSRERGPRIMMARHLADATDRDGREHLLRLAKAVTRDGGRLYLEFQTHGTPYSRSIGVRPLEVDHMRQLIAASGGVIEHTSHHDEYDEGLVDEPSQHGLPTICRMVVSWAR